MPQALTPTEQEQVYVWSPEQLRFIEWLATPREHRDPTSQALLAAEMSVRPATLSTWKQLKDFGGEVRAIARRLVSDTWLVDVYHAMYREAVGGSVSAARLLFEVAGELGERAETGSVDRRVQFIIMPAGSTALPELAPRADNSGAMVPVAAEHSDTNEPHDAEP